MSCEYLPQSGPKRAGLRIRIIFGGVHTDLRRPIGTMLLDGLAARSSCDLSRESIFRHTRVHHAVLQAILVPDLTLGISSSSQLGKMLPRKHSSPIRNDVTTVSAKLPSE